MRLIDASYGVIKGHKAMAMHAIRQRVDTENTQDSSGRADYLRCHAIVGVFTSVAL